LQHFLRCVQNKVVPRLFWDSYTKFFVGYHLWITSM
jgi:hypothetical protein